MRWGVLIAALVLLSGCLDNETPLLQADDRSDPAESLAWEWTSNGTSAWRLRFDPSSDATSCRINLLIQGRSTGFEYVGLLIVSGSVDDPYQTYLESGTSTLTKPRAEARFGAVGVQSEPLDHHDEWLVGAQEDFVVAEATVAYVAFRNAEPVGKEPPKWTGLERFPDGVWLSLTCDQAVPRPHVDEADAFAIYDERLFTGGAAAHAGWPSGGRIAHAGLQDHVSFTANNSFVLIGETSGDPAKLGTLELSGPDGDRQWVFLPTPSFVAGDVDFGHQGPSGDYTLTLNLVYPWLAVLVRVAMFSFPDATTAPA